MNNKVEIPTHLYHYTNINTLALILKHKSLRLNCILNVDDLLEGRSSDLGETIGRYVFVSSWTDLHEESIPFWMMYTGMKGVRIRMPANPFKKHDLTKIAIPNVDIKLPYSIHRSECLFKKDYLPNVSNDILTKVEYTDDKNLLFPNVFKRNADNSYILNMGLLGKYKRIEWKFQSEWRYIVQILPIRLYDLFSDKVGQIMLDAIKNKKPLPISDYYLDLDEKMIEDMEIVLAPGTNEGDKIIVESLIKQYNPKAIIKESNLKGAIKC